MEDIQFGNKTHQCCLVSENLEVQPPDHPDVHNNPDVTLRVCKVCGCRHFEASIDPMKLSVKAD